MRTKPDYFDQIQSEIRKAKKQKNAEAVVYYKRALYFSAVVSFERFKGSWAYSEWVKKNSTEIKAQQLEFNRFG